MSKRNNNKTEITTMTTEQIYDHTGFGKFVIEIQSAGSTAFCVKIKDPLNPYLWVEVYSYGGFKASTCLNILDKDVEEKKFAMYNIASSFIEALLNHEAFA
jgi:hypothetical protein